MRNTEVIVALIGHLETINALKLVAVIIYIG